MHHSQLSVGSKIFLRDYGNPTRTDGVEPSK